MEANMKKCECGGEFEFSRYCGVDVCDECEKHRKLVRCFCGWSENGGDGYQELIDMGETIDE